MSEHTCACACVCLQHVFACIGFKFYGYIFVFCLFVCCLARSCTNKNANMGKITFQINQVFAWILQHSHWRRGKSINLFSFWSNRNSMLFSLSLPLCVCAMHTAQHRATVACSKKEDKKTTSELHGNFCHNNSYFFVRHSELSPFDWFP